MPAKDTEYPIHEFADLGVSVGPSAKHPGMTTAWNENSLLCHHCLGDPEKQAACAHCAGRGVMDEIPYCDDDWTEVAPNLFVGGLATNRTKGFADVDCTSGNFDYVVSLAYPEEHNGPGNWPVGHMIIESMIDGPFSDGNVEQVEHASDVVSEYLNADQKVLVRCLAGINRSALVAALVMIKRGMSADEAIVKIRTERSPYCLFNQTYVEYLHKRSDEIHGGGDDMAMQKHGEGSVLPEEDVQKTSSTEAPEEREQRLAALDKENAEADK